MPCIMLFFDAVSMNLEKFHTKCERMLCDNIYDNILLQNKEYIMNNK